MTKCLICGSENINGIPTKMSDFLVHRIFGEDKVKIGIPVNLCHCNDCSFSFYDRRLTEDEENRLYRDYRGTEYQKIREKYDCWYTDKVNNALNSDELALYEQRRVIGSLIKRFVKEPIDQALDYGGNEGKTFDPLWDIKQKFVYDISSVPTVANVTRLPNYDELFNYSFDFIMCNMTLEHIAYPLNFLEKLYNIGNTETVYYLEVPSENPFDENKFSVLKNFKMLLNPLFSNYRLIKHFLHTKTEPYMPMHEHVNFYTPKAMDMLLRKTGFEPICIEENIEKMVCDDAKVLSVLCRKICI